MRRGDEGESEERGLGVLMRLSRERPALTLAGLAPSAAAVRIPRTINLQPPVCLWGISPGDCSVRPFWRSW